MRGLLLLTVTALALLGCNDPCHGLILNCGEDWQCHYGGLPPGLCLDDRATGRICAVYFDGCPTKLKWEECGGVNGVRSPWAARCVRPEFLPDMARDDGGALPDAGTSEMSAGVDGGAG